MNAYLNGYQVVKVELKRSVNPLKGHELIDQNHPLFIGEFFGREVRYASRNQSPKRLALADLEITLNTVCCWFE